MENIKACGYAPVNGLKMYYEIHGEDNIPLVLLHGGGSCIETSFGNILPLLSRHRKVIAVEMQAHGRTSDRDAPESFEQDADDVAALLSYLTIDKANIFGYSNGGTTALQLAIRHPAIINKIISLAGAYERHGFIDGFFDGFKDATLDRMPAALQTAFLKITPDPARLQVMFDKDVERMKNFKDIPDSVVRSIKAPVLVMASDKDVVRPEHGLKMSRVIPGAALVILPGFHGLCIGVAEAGPLKKGSKLVEVTAALIEDFLNE